MLLNRNRAEGVMRERGLNAIVASNMVNVYYLSNYSTDASWGFGGLAAAVLPLDENLSPAVVHTAVSGGMWLHRGGPWMPTRLFGGAENPWNNEDPVGSEGYVDLSGLEPIGASRSAAVRAHLDDLGLLDGPVGFDDIAFGLDVASHGHGRNFEVVPAVEVFREIRMIKTDEELLLIRAASRKTRIALEAGIDAIAAGGTALDAERTFWATLSLMGSQPMMLSTMPYRPGVGRLPRPAPLAVGDLVTFDAVSGYGHYYSDLGRSAIIGPPAREQLEVFGAIRRGWAKAKPYVRPGIKSDEIRRALLEAVHAEGNLTFNSGGVHSLGLEHDDQPRSVSGKVPFVVEAGMVLSIDMPYLETGTGQFHSEELVYVTQDGLEDINDTDNRLYLIENEEVIRV